MSTVERTVTTSAAPDAVFEFLADFENATEWDSGTVSCEKVSGDGGPGTVYKNVSRFAGNEVTLDYTVERVDEPVFVIVGRNDTTTSHDTITVSPSDGGGSSVVYRAEFTFTGIVKLLGPVMGLLLGRLGDKTAAQLKSSLDRL